MRSKLMSYAFTVIIILFAIAAEHATAQTLCGISIGDKGEAGFVMFENSILGNKYEVSPSYFADSNNVIYQIHVDFAKDFTQDEFSSLVLSFSDFYNVKLTFYQSVVVKDQKYYAFVGNREGIGYYIYYQKLGTNADLITNIIFIINSSSLEQS